MPNLLSRKAKLWIAGGALATILLPLSLSGPADAGLIPVPARASSIATPVVADPQIAALRAKGPRALDELLARYDRLHAERAREALARTIDAVAGQRYATVSRLYWHTDLEAAKAAARTEGKPILSLRMLGRLDEDRSCANSRFFRTTLYANARIGKLLRERFVLHWSTERPVPQVTIDMGDGRKIETTTTGNSAHYVLDERARVVDVLPGLYSPIAFESELGKSLALAKSLRGLDDEARRTRLVAHHRAAIEDIGKRTADAAKLTYIVGGRRLLDPEARVALAQRATMMKSRVEIPVLAAIGKTIDAVPASDLAQWASIGQSLWQLAPASRARLGGAFPLFAPRVLDAQSIALVTRVFEQGHAHDASVTANMLARLEHALVADAALNEVRLRTQIRHYLAGGEFDFARVNDWVYASVFHTPRADPWLGLVSRQDFTGLPGDGVMTAQP